MQVFRKDGSFVSEAFFERSTRPNGICRLAVNAGTAYAVAAAGGVPG